MNCSTPQNKPDWKAYALGELSPEDRREAEGHATACETCREELATLRLTLDTLSTLREEEVPRRIAFVSDKVFEPRWWQRFLNPTFASACVLAGAIVFHAAARPSVTEEQIQARIDAAVSRVEAQQEAMAFAVDQTYKFATQTAYRTSGLERQ
jgi:anti-sigma factor RsiW